MKHLKQTLLVTLLASVAALAQVDIIDFSKSSGSSKFGIHAGLGLGGFNHANQLEKTLDNEIKLVASIGGLFMLPVSNAVNFVPEALITYAAMPGEKSSDVRIDIPALLRFYPLVATYFQIGPQLGLSLNSKGDDGKSHDKRNSFEIGPVFGLGYQIDADMSIDIRYFYSVAKYFDYNGASAQSYQLLVGISYLF